MAEKNTEKEEISNTKLRKLGNMVFRIYLKFNAVYFAWYGYCMLMIPIISLVYPLIIYATLTSWFIISCVSAPFVVLMIHGINKLWKSVENKMQRVVAVSQPDP